MLHHFHKLNYCFRYNYVCLFMCVLHILLVFSSLPLLLLQFCYNHTCYEEEKPSLIKHLLDIGTRCEYLFCSEDTLAPSSISRVTHFLQFDVKRMEIHWIYGFLVGSSLASSVVVIIKEEEKLIKCEFNLRTEHNLLSSLIRPQNMR